MIDKLIERIAELQNPSVVGLDPRLSMVPKRLMDEAESAAGDKAGVLEKAAEALFLFNREIMDGICDIVPAVKPQIALYELFGVPGLDAFRRTVRYAHEKGLLVIGDIKRGDIASTAEAYAAAHLGASSAFGDTEAAFDEDFVTLNPYMGTDSVSPFFPYVEQGKGLFLLVKTSNPGGKDLQDLPLSVPELPEAAAAKKPRTVYEAAGDLVEKWGEPYMGRYGFSRVGAVVGATYPEESALLRRRLPHTFFLVPGYGAQGASADMLKGCFHENGLGAIVNSSRGILAAHQSSRYARFGDDVRLAARQAALDMKSELLEILGEIRL